MKCVWGDELCSRDDFYFFKIMLMIRLGDFFWHGPFVKFENMNCEYFFLRKNFVFSFILLWVRWIRFVTHCTIFFYFRPLTENPIFLENVSHYKSLKIFNNWKRSRFWKIYWIITLSVELPVIDFTLGVSFYWIWGFWKHLNSKYGRKD